jgi:RHH-type transcriptional regulator, proline utilization regulon repressor / proline dehydrogenase / delta 1-pyrroline-5-carboxylate dehydrogenase
MRRATDKTIDELALESIESARRLIDEAERLRSRRDRAIRRQFVRLFRDPDALGVTIALTDEVMRFRSVTSAVRTLRRAARRSSVTGFGLANALGLRLIALASRLAPGLVVRVVHQRIRGLSDELILDADVDALRRHATLRRESGLALNVNVLGEAVLGEREAQARLERVLEMIRRPDVNYVSVKLSALVSQIVTIDRVGSLARVSRRLRELYRASGANGVFVNLDMEEFRDLRLTVAAFRGVLSEEEFEAISAGIVLQAYLPDSHDAFDELIEWARARHAGSGGRIKIRLVKGANLAMEHAEARLHGWTSAPYPTKADVDASYARLIDLILRADIAPAVRVGVASHNLFHVSWALDVARSRGVEGQLDIEMLEGMAPAEATALVRRGHTVLLYAPVTRRDDFASAVAYLVRRLDENTAKENYLRAAFSIAKDPEVFEEQRRRFLDSVEHRHHLATASRRHQPSEPAAGGFHNASDGDPTATSYVEGITRALGEVRARDMVEVGDPPGGDAERIEHGGDPSRGNVPWYRYRVATASDVDAAVDRARAARAAWRARGAEGRGRILNDAARVMEARRGASIAVMARDTGKTVVEADPEVSEAVDFARYYAAHVVDDDASDPLGVVLVVPPWNFPLSIPTGGVTAALAAGNTVILKPAPEAVAVGWELARQLWEAGVPREVLQFVTTRDDDDGRRLVTHPGVDAVILTGSFDTARLFTSWKPGLTLLAETSGKNAIVVTACADVDLAVKDLVHSAFSNAGQKCSAASLAIVDRATYDNPLFVSQLVDAVTSLRVGAAYDLSSVVGPVIRRADGALERALTQLDEGESWLVEPEAVDEQGLLWRPGVKVGVRPGSWSHLHEWFGPVLGVMVAPDLDTAIKWQNGVGFGLTAGIHSLDEGECERWIEAVEAGNLYVNRAITGAVVQRQPFGGWKRSSVGPTAKAGGPNYVNCLRRWPRVHDLDAATGELREWWASEGSRALDRSGLDVERNELRYRRHPAPVAVRVDGDCEPVDASYLREIASVTGATLELSCAGRPDGLEVVTETVEELVARSGGFSRVRWLSHEPAPAEALLERGLSTDRRPLAQAGAVEGPRWLLEQSVAITSHRYGNVHAGPQPRCPGLGSGPAV